MRGEVETYSFQHEILKIGPFIGYLNHLRNFFRHKAIQHFSPVSAYSNSLYFLLFDFNTSNSKWFSLSIRNSNKWSSSWIYSKTHAGGNMCSTAPDCTNNCSVSSYINYISYLGQLYPRLWHNNFYWHNYSGFILNENS